MKNQRTLFDETDDDHDAAALREVASPLGVQRGEASSASLKGGAPCQEGDGESPSQRCGDCDELLSVGHRDFCIQEHLNNKDIANAYITDIEAEAYVSNPPQTQPTQAALDQAERMLIEVGAIDAPDFNAPDRRVLPMKLGPADSLWREMPHDQFMALSEHDQLDYCARRDEDSARFADTYEDEQWYLWRARWYREVMKKL